ncbi:hypothetical protein VTN31DRAFT_3959 [Thermomyces dupontii]|uniref:uncharacterized protein n=1 Tax=Talaromyces thermophilus TaxID=28565 RepID=UPI00374319FE
MSHPGGQRICSRCFTPLDSGSRSKYCLTCRSNPSASSVNLRPQQAPPPAGQTTMPPVSDVSAANANTSMTQAVPSRGAGRPPSATTRRRVCRTEGCARFTADARYAHCQLCLAEKRRLRSLPSPAAYKSCRCGVSLPPYDHIHLCSKCRAQPPPPETAVTR